MPRGYKHISTEFGERFAKGLSVQLGTYEHYRGEERERGDPLEGVTEYTVDRLEPAHQLLPEYADVRALVGLPREGVGMNVIFRNNTFRYLLPPAYIFCCSNEPDFSRVELGEAIYEIASMDLFAHRLSRCTPSLGRWRSGCVKYETRSVNPFRAPLLDQGPFLKSGLFIHEDEFRVVWDSARITTPTIQIKCPKVSDLIIRVA